MDYKSLFRGNLPIATPKDLITLAADKGVVLKEIIATNGFGANPYGFTDGWASCPGPEGVFYVAVKCGTGAAIVEVASSPADGSTNVRLVAGLPGATGTGGGTGIAARFGTYIMGMAYFGGKLYLVDTNANKIRVMDTSTYVVSDFAGSGASGQADNATGTLATFVSPRSICVDPLGTFLYVGQGGSTSSIRRIQISNTTVTTLAGTAGASANTHTDAVVVSQDGLYLYYTNREQVSAATSFLYRYTLSSNTRTSIAQSTGNAGTAVVANGIFAMGASQDIVLFGSSSYTSLCPDPNDPQSFYYFVNGNTGGGGGSNRIHKVTLLGPPASPTHFEIKPFAGANGSPASPTATEGLGSAGPILNSTASFMASAVVGRSILFVDTMVTSAIIRVLLVDTEDASCAFALSGATGLTAYNGCGNTGRKVYLSLWVRKALEGAARTTRRILSRQEVNVGETLAVDLASKLEPGDTLVACAANGMLYLEANGLEVEAA